MTLPTVSAPSSRPGEPAPTSGPGGVRVAVVVPVHRNAETLEALHRRLAAALAVAGAVWTLRLVVDACPEGSAEVAERLARHDPRVRVTVLPDNLGQHRALAVGLELEADADVWVCLDADLQDPPEAVAVLIGELVLTGRSGVFAGRRGAYESPARRWTGRAHRRLMSRMTGLPVDAGAFFAMDRDLRDAVVAGVRDHAAPSVVAAAGASGLPLTSVSVTRATRPVGTSSWTLRARIRQSARTLTWAAQRRRHPLALRLPARPETARPMTDPLTTPARLP